MKNKLIPLTKLYLTIQQPLKKIKFLARLFLNKSKEPLSLIHNLYAKFVPFTQALNQMIQSFNANLDVKRLKQNPLNTENNHVNAHVTIRFAGKAVLKIQILSIMHSSKKEEKKGRVHKY